MGGSGLRSAVQHSPAAFIASSAQTRGIVDGILPACITRRSLDSAFPLLQTHSGNAAYSSIELLPCEFTQHSLSAEIDALSRSRLLSQADARNKARLHSLALPHAGNWVDAPPSLSLNLNLDSRSFAAVMAYRLGLPIMASSECCALTCDQQQDALGDHAMHCHDDHAITLTTVEPRALPLSPLWSKRSVAGTRTP